MRTYRWRVVWLPVLLVGGGLLILWPTMVVDALRRALDAYELEGRSRNSTVLLVLITGWFGALYYLFAIRPGLVRAEHDLRSRQRAQQASAQPTQRCIECGLSSISVDDTRCKNCGSDRLERLDLRGGV